MYRSRLKVKTLILLCMTGVLDDPGDLGEIRIDQRYRAGRRRITDIRRGRLSEETEVKLVGQEKTWTSPGRNAKIRVLLLDQKWQYLS